MSCSPAPRPEEENAGPGGRLVELSKRLVERAIEVELTDTWVTSGFGSRRAGLQLAQRLDAKTLICENGPVGVQTDPARPGWLSVRDIEAHLAEIYGVNIGRDLISRVTDAVFDDVREWGKRLLETSTRSCSWTAWS